jgi:hypothetical protein
LCSIFRSYYELFKHGEFSKKELGRNWLPVTIQPVFTICTCLIHIKETQYRNTHIHAREGSRRNQPLTKSINNLQNKENNVIKSRDVAMHPISPQASTIFEEERQRQPKGLEKHHRRTCCFYGPHKNTAAGDAEDFGAHRPGRIPHFSKHGSYSTPRRATRTNHPTCIDQEPDEATRNRTAVAVDVHGLLYSPPGLLDGKGV